MEVVFKRPLPRIVAEKLQLVSNSFMLPVRILASRDLRELQNILVSRGNWLPSSFPWEPYMSIYN